MTQSKFSLDTMQRKYSHTRKDGTLETWDQIADRVVTTVFSAVDAPDSLVETTRRLVREKAFVPGGRYLYATGRRYHQVQNCLLLKATDSRHGWGELMEKITLALMTGAGIGVDYSDLRPEGSKVRGTGGVSTGPIALMEMVNEAGRRIMQGGSRRSAIWAGLRWDHPDVHRFVHLKDWSEDVKRLKAQDYNFPATMDLTNISVQLNDEFFAAYGDESHPKHETAQNVYWDVVRQMVTTAEPGFSVDTGENAGETLRNACTEVSSSESDDICNIGSINMAKIETLEQMQEAVDSAIAFLLAGSVYSDVPYPDVDKVRTKNRRLGLGLMGVHEWLLKRGLKYGTPEAMEALEPFLVVYAKSTDVSHDWADCWGLTHPVKTRAIAPTGTIGIVAETTTGIEPIFAAAYERRYIVGKDVHWQYVLDATAHRLVTEHGVRPADLEDAYSLSKDVERRVAFQAFVQRYVDHGISSTVNLPRWGSPENNESTVRPFGEMLMKYLPDLRGITTYPDGARSGQPLTVADYEVASKYVGEVFIESADVCDVTKSGGTCGS